MLGLGGLFGGGPQGGQQRRNIFERGLSGLASAGRRMGQANPQTGVSGLQNLGLALAAYSDNPMFQSLALSNVEDTRNQFARTREQEQMRQQREQLLDTMGLQGQQRAQASMLPLDVLQQQAARIAFPEQTPTEYETFEQGGSRYRFNPQTGEAEVIVQGQERPNYELRTVGSDLYRVDPMTGESILVQRGQQQARPRDMREDANGVLRYVDTGEPVFAGEVQGEGARVRLSAEQMGRIAPNLPGLIEAQNQLQALDESGVTFTSGAEGSRWGGARNVAATVAGGVPLSGDFLERIAGTNQRDQLVRASSQFEAAVLPILSGAAVTDSEARRYIRAALPQPGDSAETRRLKSEARRGMIEVFQAAVEGRPVDFGRLNALRDTVENATDQQSPGAQGGNQPIVIDY